MVGGGVGGDSAGGAAGSGAAGRDANDWEWVRVLAQGRVYDEERAALNRVAWAAVALAASRGGERSGVRRARAVADRLLCGPGWWGRLGFGRRIRICWWRMCWRRPVCRIGF